MKFSVTNRWTGRVQFTAEIECSEEVAMSAKLGLAVRWAIANSANLTGANLTGANLTRANLTDADLTGADLTGADLTDANLTGANLTRANLTDADLARANLARANLTGADLTDANLTDANLARANLTGADLTDANLTGADLTDADLTDADLTGADLTGADLTGADLARADLTDADLTAIRDDIWAVLSASPREVPFLRAALLNGMVDGSAYEGQCACLVGTLANARKCNYEKIPGLVPNSNRPAEKFFFSINKGDTPDNSQFSKLALEWIDQWLANVRTLTQTEAAQ